MLAWKLCCTGRRVVGDVVVLNASTPISGSTREEEGGRNSKYGANEASQNIKSEAKRS